MKLSSNKELVDILADQVLALDNQLTVVGINGKDGSGKTVLADSLAKKLRILTEREVIRISIDDFMHERAYRKRNPDEAKGCYEDTFDYESFRRWALEPFLPGANRRYRTKIFDYETDSICKSDILQASVDAIIIIDGVFLFREDLKGFFHLKILLEVSDETSLVRGVDRDVTMGRSDGDRDIAREKYQKRYLASQKIYYAEADPIGVSDTVVDYDDLECPVII